MLKLDNETIELALIALVALAMLTQAIVLLAAFVALRKAARAIDEKVEDIRSSVMPLVDKTRELLTALTPKIQQTTEDLGALAHSLRVQTGDVRFAANEIIARVRTQTGRIDALLTSVLDAVERAGGFMTDAVAKPMRQLSAILASVKAAVEALRTIDAAPPDDTRGGTDLFI
ncbi:MAG: hypothetical protein ABSF23_06050 [Terracidiphilus sp.]|jgi:phage-related protein